MRLIDGGPKAVAGAVSLVSLVVGVCLGAVVTVRSGRFAQRRDRVEARRRRLAELYTDLLQAGLSLMNFTWPYVDARLPARPNAAGARYTVDDRNAEEAQQLGRLQVAIARLSAEGDQDPLADLAEELRCAFCDCRRLVRLYEGGQYACEGEIERARDAYRTKLNQLNAAVRPRMEANDRSASA